MNGGNYVSLMTIHVAKGLEFDNVFVIAMNEGTFPSDRARMEGGRDAEEEERRLAYVAMTRARKNLYLSCNSSYSYVTDSAGAPSMFMKEAGVELPPDQDHNLWGATNWRSNGARFRGSNNGWRKVAQQSSSSFFEDGDAIDPFEKPKPKPEPERPANNGISDWRVGDIAIHEKFGEGVVTSVLNGSIIVVEFKEQGKKTLLASHPLLSRKASKGGLA
jgi:DNA helicase-2/ATP-dependent DNA helicase PcrA